MALDAVHNVEIPLKDCSTQSVTLGHERATVVREIADVGIKPGPNKISIYGFDPLVGAESIRVTGRGPATITDTQTEVIPQKEQLDPLWDDEGDSADLEDWHVSDSELGLDRSELQRVEDELQDLESKRAAAVDDEAAATRCLEFLDSYGNSLSGPEIKPATVEEYIHLYKAERPKLNQQHQQAVALRDELAGRIKKQHKERDRLSRAFDKAKREATKVHRQQRAEELKSRQLKAAEKRRLRDEKAKFHPDQIGQLVLHLDGSGDGSQSSSRRNSTTSSNAPDSKDPAPNPETLSLSVTYVIPQATWTPRYEVFLETPSASGKIIYRAEYHNWSSETWQDAKVIFSNSQTSFSGVNETIPVLQSWSVKLLKDDAHVTNANTKTHWKHAMANDAEVQAKFLQKQAPKAFDGRTGNLFNVRQNANAQAAFADLDTGPAANPVRFRRTIDTLAAPNAAPTTQDPFTYGSQAHPQQRAGGHDPYSDDGYDSEESDNSTLTEPSNELAFQESSRHDYGLTTTFELSGHRTLQPSSLSRRHIIAELDISSVTYSHVVVPKLRPAAFLKARFVNSSSTSFLRGKAGLSLDGTFLGTTAVPNCSPNSAVSLPLGVDPAIQVNYAKPTVRRATTGFFNKEDCAVFTRVCRIVNTKSNPVSVTAFDQVPVSEDERLRVRILEPKGIEKDGDSAKMGEVSKRAWGQGTVKMGKNGEIKWDMTLNKGAEVRLTLEYDARIPTGQKIVGLD